MAGLIVLGCLLLLASYAVVSTVADDRAHLKAAVGDIQTGDVGAFADEGKKHDFNKAADEVKKIRLRWLTSTDAVEKAIANHVEIATQDSEFSASFLPHVHLIELACTLGLAVFFNLLALAWDLRTRLGMPLLVAACGTCGTVTGLYTNRFLPPDSVSDFQAIGLIIALCLATIVGILILRVRRIPRSSLLFRLGISLLFGALTLYMATKWSAERTFDLTSKNVLPYALRIQPLTEVTRGYVRRAIDMRSDGSGAAYYWMRFDVPTRYVLGEGQHVKIYFRHSHGPPSKSAYRGAPVVRNFPHCAYEYSVKLTAAGFNAIPAAGDPIPISPKGQTSGTWSWLLTPNAAGSQTLSLVGRAKTLGGWTTTCAKGEAVTLFERVVTTRITGGFFSAGSTEQLAKIAALMASVVGVAATVVSLLRRKGESATLNSRPGAPSSGR